MTTSAPAYVEEAPLRLPPLDYERLADHLAALAYPTRLELLDALRFPHTLSDIRVTPHRKEAGATPDRIVTRQTVQKHLDRLVDAEFVRTDPVEQEGRTVPSYIVNASRLYELTEEMRRLSLRYAGHGPAGDATGTIGHSAAPARHEGPRVVLVHGVYEGKVFALDRASGPEARWLLGRRRELPIALDYDPFVSQEHALLLSHGGRFSVTDLGSKNGTHVNWTPLARGASQQLRSGDVIGVGRSLLSFVPQ